MPVSELSRLAYYLALIGGMLMIVLGLVGFFGSFGGYFLHWGSPTVES